MSNIITKIFTSLVLLIAFFAVVSVGSEAKAADSTGRLMHAFTPHRDSVTGEMIARVNNTSMERFDGWVCATEKTSSGRNVHLGCLKTNLDPVWSGGNWSFQFGVMTKFGGSVHYTYQGADKVWRSVRSAV